MTKIVQITDTHLVAPGRSLFGLDPADRLRLAVRTVAAVAPDAALCVVTGDLADIGEVAAYEALGPILAELPMPVRLLLGNHDDRANFRAAMPDAPVDENGFVQSAFDIPEGRLLFLDTREAGTHAGRLCEARLGWLAAALAEARDRPVWLFLHHPPFAVGMDVVDAINLLDGEAFGRVLARHPDVRHLFLGHVHRPIAGSWRGIPFTVLYGTVHQSALNLGPLDLPLLEGPCHVAVALLEADRTVVHMHDALAPHRRTPRAFP
jgi:3',5'-cyclic AMP phosphodiesterase CpdA